MAPLSLLIVLLTVMLMFWTIMRVGRARGRYQIHAPAVSGHPDFERVYRVQMNTLEQVAMFLPTFVIAAQYGDALWANALGASWLLGRAWYVIAYSRAANKRGPAFILGMLAWFGLLLLAFWGVGRLLLA